MIREKRNLLHRKNFCMECIRACFLYLSLLVLCSTSSAKDSGQCAVSIGDQITLRGVADVKDVRDADTFWLGIHKIRLYGVEALEPRQPCYKNEKKFGCAAKSAEKLKDLLDEKEISCTVNRVGYGRPEMDRNRYLATCEFNGEDISTTLVKAGWLLAAEGDRGELYRSSEDLAATAKLGIHQATFVRPREFRESQKTSDPCPRGSHQCVMKAKPSILPQSQPGKK